jgi:hypothetical protein
MGYERNDRRYGGNPGDRGGYGQDADRNRSYGYGSRDYRGDRFDNRDYQSRNWSGSDNDRGFFERAGDEVKSWFGDEDAERRRREDMRDDDRYRGYDADRGWQQSRSGYEDRQRSSWSGGDRDYSRGSSSYSVPRYGNDQRSGNHRNDHDPHYSSWRERQIQALDRDYDDYRRENQSRFDNEFHGWRQNRQSQRDLLKQVQEHQEVVGSDGGHVGKVDHVRGDDIQLAKSDPAAGGRHHRIPASWVQSVDDKVTLNKTADQAKQQWRDDERNSGGGFFRSDDKDDGNVNLNRSFSGTY